MQASHLEYGWSCNPKQKMGIEAFANITRGVIAFIGKKSPDVIFYEIKAAERIYGEKNLEIAPISLAVILKSYADKRLTVIDMIARRIFTNDHRMHGSNELIAYLADFTFQPLDCEMKWSEVVKDIVEKAKLEEPSEHKALGLPKAVEGDEGAARPCIIA